MNPMKRVLVLLAVVLGLFVATGCSLCEYRLVWSSEAPVRGGESTVRAWEKRDQYYACYGCAAYVMVENALGIPPQSVLEWGVIPDEGYVADDLGKLATWNEILPDYQRFFEAGKHGGTGTVYAKYGPNAEDVATSRITVFPQKDLPVGTHWDIDGDGIDDIISSTIRDMQFPFGVRLENVDTMPDTLAAVPVDAQAPNGIEYSPNPEGGRWLVVFKTSGGQVFAGVVGYQNGIPHLIYRKLRGAA